MTATQIEILKGLSRDLSFRVMSLRLNTPQNKLKDEALRTVEQLGCSTLAGAVAVAIRRKLID